jgi:hypothetical protein
MIFEDLVRWIDEMDDILDDAAPNTLLQELRQQTDEITRRHAQFEALRAEHRALAQSLELQDDERWSPPTEEEIGYHEYRDAIIRSMHEAQAMATRSKEPRTSVNWKKEGF